MNAQRVMAIFEKDLKDFMKNTMTIFYPVIPIFLAILYSRIGGEEEIQAFFAYMVVGITFAVIPAGSMMTMMAEENEKKTLRGLTLSPASFGDIIVGKSLVTVLLTIFTLVISFVFIAVDPFLNVRAMISLVLMFLFFLFIGIGVGFFVNTVGMTTAYLMPVMFIFGFTPMLEMLQLSETGIVMRVVDTLPIPQLIEIEYTNSWLPVGVISLWVIGAAIFMYICYVRTKIDS